MNRKKLTADFFDDEFWSPDKNIAKMEAEFMFKLQKLRTAMGIDFTIMSGYRTEEFNIRIGSKPEGYHPKGIAADIDHQKWDGQTKHKFLICALTLGFSIGIYQRYFHLDNRTGPKTLWIGKNPC